MATRADIIRLAMRRLGVLSADEALTADHESYVGDILDGMFATLKNVQGFTFTWALDATPDEAYLPMGYLLATEPAVYEHFAVTPREPQSRALIRLRAYAFPNDIDDRRDVDDDGVISEAEEAEGKRAAYY